MAITLEDQHVLANNGDFINRVRQAACTVAFEVMEEVQGGMSQAEMQARHNLARQVINDAQASAQRAAFTLATQSPTVNPLVIPDANYIIFLQDNWTRLSGFNPNLPTGEVVP
jgi:hypothetical protein